MSDAEVDSFITALVKTAGFDGDEEFAAPMRDGVWLGAMKTVEWLRGRESLGLKGEE